MTDICFGIEELSTIETPLPIPTKTSSKKEGKKRKIHQKTNTIKEKKIKKEEVNDMICTECKHFRYHNFEITTPHKSCLCNFVNNNSICCIIGHENWVRNIPLIGIFIPSPQRIFKPVNNINDFNPDEYIDIAKSCATLKLEIVHHLKNLYPPA